ncbi:tetratricopeptide repeat protein [endosymbiont of unidentified scaly snail isolate Monju]|uniref:tetratricopeptide repeat protein n=1 Tax=endosymbiont of unidentified scaly snail isolate Monju TaxID=1248727 RepID=UPI0009DF8CE9|nr:tetratricopeptide repeat protein [endosymbiont of unidentified scaly snail isolate Monju]
MKSPCRLLPITLSLVLSACGGGMLSKRPDVSSEAATAARQAPKALPFPAPERPAVSLDQDLLLDYLVGEIGACLGDFGKSARAYLEAAERARDPYAAERATRIAWHVQDMGLAQRAARLWVELAPNSLAARQFLGLALLRAGQSAGALVQFRAMLEIAHALGKDGYLLVAGALAREQDKGRALALMRQLAGETPDAAGARYGLALLLTSQHRYPEAESLLRQVLHRTPERAEAWSLLARVLIARGQRDAALDVLEQALDHHPGNRRLRLSRARLLVAAERYEDALAQFRELYRRDPKDLQVLFGYAMLATQQQRWEEARRLWQALRGSPRFANDATYFLGQVEEASGNKVTAIGLYRSVNQGDLRADATIRAAVLIAEDVKRLDEARQLLRRAREAVPKRKADLYLAEIELLRQHGANRAEILGLYEEALKALPGNTDLLYGRGLYYSEVGDHAAMERDFRQVLKQDPQHADALNALGYMLAQRNVRLQEARRYIEQALQLKPDSPAVLDSMGWVLYRLGQLEAARDYLQRAWQRDHDAEITGHLIEVLWALGERRKARRLLEEALREGASDEYLSRLRQRLLESGS